MLLWQRAAEARAGMDRDESTVMGCDIEIYQTVNADADSYGPGSDRGRAHCHCVKAWIFRLRFSGFCFFRDSALFGSIICTVTCRGR